MSPFYDLQININGEYTFFLNKNVITEYSRTLKKMIKQSNNKKKKKASEIITMEINDFPCGQDGFELISRFCYNNGTISINLTNVSTLYCCSVFLDMTEKKQNLLFQTETYLQQVFYGSLNDIVSCLKNCEQVFLYADSYGLVDKLVFSALKRVSRNNSEELSSSTSSSLASTLSSKSVSCGRSNEWWFDDMSNLSPRIILKLIRIIEAYDTDIKGLVVTRFILHYLKTKHQTRTKVVREETLECSVLAETAAKGVIFEAKTTFSCRKLLWVLCVLSGFRLSLDSKTGLETLIGEKLDQATLDDLLICARRRRNKESGGVYNVGLVIRLLKVFVKKREEEEEKMKCVGRLIDKYLKEISPDCDLKVSKFLGVLESLPDSARDCFDGVYLAIDIYLQSHQNLTPQDRTKLCRCLNYKKLTLQTCKQLARNPKIPPDIAIQALKSISCDHQQHKTPEAKVVNKTVSCRYSEDIKKNHYKKEKNKNHDVVLHLKGFEISAEKLGQGLIKSSGRYNWNVMDSFRQSLS
ncbi:unnamed protein product [Cochlearia groenlandica]